MHVAHSGALAVKLDISFPAMLDRLGFWPTLAACVFITLVCFSLLALTVRRYGIDLL